MRIQPWLIEFLLQLINHRYIKKMLHAVSGFMEMVIRQGKVPGHVRFPKPVRADEMFSMFATGICQRPRSISTSDKSLQGKSPARQSPT